ncbi:MAG TPA: hypothetical protein VNH21_01280 [Steroidobacteraceae bacterium]|nr:hypothetical protein [Steroidobacteraceae bacterium]
MLDELCRDIRSYRLRDMLGAIEEWRHATGSERDFWRATGLNRIREFRRLHLVPERAAFEAAVARSQIRRAA